MFLNCLKCGAEFKTFPCIIKSGKGKFCSMSCNAKYNHDKLVEGRNKLLQSGYKIVTPKRGLYIKCPICSKSFYRAPSQLDHKCCSHKCSGEYRKSNYVQQGYKPKHKTRGDNHYNWKGGRSKTDKRQDPMYREWRTSVFVRDAYTCQKCGIKSGCGKRVHLQADHILPFALYPELAFDINNGRTLCVDCHRKTPSYGMNKRYVIRTGNQLNLFS